LGEQHINFFTEVETIFPYGNHLFLGSTNGVFIYDISFPSTPQYISEFTHVTSCDPVYVSDSIAFVTLRSNTSAACQGFTNQLDVLDIHQIDQPRLIESFDMQSPHGLGVVDSLIFICEGDHGLKTFTYRTEKQNGVISKVNIQQKSWIQEITAIDLIPLSDRIIVVGREQLHQYRYGPNGELRHLSTIQ
jgi:hypothetical protein